jgi:hypothetical protein
MGDFFASNFEWVIAVLAIGFLVVVTLYAASRSTSSRPPFLEGWEFDC